MAIRLNTYYEDNKNLSLKEVMKKIVDLETWLNSDERIIENKIADYKAELKVLRRIEREKLEMLDKKFKLSNGRYAVDQETKEEFYNYMSKVNRYNEQVANGQTPDINMGDLLNEYTNTFYDEALEEKLKKIEEDFNNREKDTKIDDLISQIDSKLDEINNKE